MPPILLYTILGTIIIALLIFIVKLKTQLSNKDNKYKEFKSKYQELHDVICSAQDRVTPIIEERNKFEAKYKEVLQKYNKDLQNAKLIDNMLFAERINVADVFPKSFVFEKAKEQIAGDFYWIERKGDLVYIIIGDCVYYNLKGLLSKQVVVGAVKEIIQNSASHIDAAQCFSQIHQSLRRKCHHSWLNQQLYSALAVCIINDIDKMATLSGIYHSVLHSSNNSFNVYKGEVIGISKQVKSDHKFINTKFEIKDNDCLYFYTNGYMDQFGGEHKKRFMTKNLKKMISEIKDNDMKIQGETVSQIFKSWQGRMQQTDDVLLIGVQF